MQADRCVASFWDERAGGRACERSSVRAFERLSVRAFERLGVRVWSAVVEAGLGVSTISASWRLIGERGGRLSGGGGRCAVDPDPTTPGASSRLSWRVREREVGRECCGGASEAVRRRESKVR